MHQSPLRPLFAALLLATFGADASPPGSPPAVTQPHEQVPWGTPAQDLESRLTVTNSPTKGSPVQVKVELHNRSDKPVTLARIRVWLMVAQGPQRVMYTTPAAGPEKKSLEPDASLTVSFDAALLDAFPYSPALVIKNGLPTAPAGEVVPLPAALGKLTDFLPAGRSKAKAFVVVTRLGMLTETPETFVVPSNAFTMDVRERTLGAMDPTAQRATLEELTALFHGDAVSAKAGHDRALSIGKGAIPHLIDTLGDDKLSGPGRMWLTATLLELKDDRANEAVINLLDKGGSAAYVVAYMGPRMKEPAVTAAVQKAARGAKDPQLTAWAVRGLGASGEPIDASLLEPMVTHSDSAGRVEAADILAAHPSPEAASLLAQLIRDREPTVRVHAASAASDHGRRDPVILQALQSMKNSPDDASRKAADDALDRLKGH